MRLEHLLTKYVDNHTKQKVILVNLGLVVYNGEKEATYQETLKFKCENRKRSVEVIPSSNKKTKSKNNFTLPEILSINIMAPVELQPDLKQAKTHSSTPLGTIEVKFRKYFIKGSNTSTSPIASVDNNDSSTSSSDSDIFTALENRGEKGESDDENDAIVQELQQSEQEPDNTPVQVHIYKSIKNILGAKI